MKETILNLNGCLDIAANSTGSYNTFLPGKMYSEIAKYVMRLQLRCCGEKQLFQKNECNAKLLYK